VYKLVCDDECRANLSELYFTHRQDRYIMLSKCPSLADFFDQLISSAQKYSFQLRPDNTVQLADGVTCHPFAGTATNCLWLMYTFSLPGDHFYGKPGNVGNLTAVSEMSEILLKVREVSGKKSCQGKVTLNCLLLAAYLRSFLTLLSLCILYWFQIMPCCIPTPTTDNNTTTIKELSGNFTLSGEWSTCL